MTGLVGSWEQIAQPRSSWVQMKPLSQKQFFFHSDRLLTLFFRKASFNFVYLNKKMKLYCKTFINELMVSDTFLSYYLPFVLPSKKIARSVTTRIMSPEIVEIRNYTDNTE